MDREITGENDGRRIPDGSEIETDVCVVGAGPAGISVALDLARAGVQVLLLESGSLHPEDGARDSAKAESVGQSYFPIHTTRASGFGGSSALWIPELFRTAPLTPLDFASRDGIPYSGWPFPSSVVDPYYEKASVWCGLTGRDFRPSTWVTDETPALPFESDDVGTAIFQSGPVDVWKNRYEESRRLPTLRVLFHSRVVEILTDGPRVRSLSVRVPGGPSFRITPRATVLAMGGLENPRILLLSRREHADGVGNQHDLVGRFFQEHLAARGGLLTFRDRDRYRRMGLYRMHDHPDGGRIQAKIALGQDLLRSRGLLGCAFFVTEMTRARAGQPSRSVAVLRRTLTWRPIPRDLSAHAARVLFNLPEAIVATAEHARDVRSPEILQLLSEAEQSPNPDSRVTLSQTHSDALGLPRARVDWRLTDLDRRSIVDSQRVIDEALHQAGLGRLEHMIGDEGGEIPLAGHWHHMGTTRMHDDPRQGVVDGNCRVHGMSNLFIAGSSVFPTSGYANPTFTIVALALRLADHLRADLPTL